MTEKAKGTMDEGEHFSALLNYLSKAFDCVPHDLLIAKLDALYYLIFNYLNNRKQKVKINLSFRSFQKIISGVPQGPLLCPLLVNIFLTYIFLFWPTEIASYADENTPYATGDCLEKLYKKQKKSQTLSLNSSLIIIWSQMQTNIITLEQLKVKIENEIIKNSLQEKLLGIVIDNRLIFQTTRGKSF